jgi:hypothetical protein
MLTHHQPHIFVILARIGANANEMTSLSVHFAKALQSGRRMPKPVDTRAALLVSLLNKRAVARNMGAEELEQLLRQQILWSLPTIDTAEESSERNAA